MTTRPRRHRNILLSATLLLGATIFVLGKDVFHSKTVDVTLGIRSRIDSFCQVFWTEKPGTPFTPGRSKLARVFSEGSVATLSLPAERIERLRVDFGAGNTAFRAGPVLVSGSERTTLDWNDFDARHDMKSFTVDAGGAVDAVPSGIDPYAVYNRPIGIRCRRTVHPMTTACFAALILLVCLQVARPNHPVRSETEPDSARARRLRIARISALSASSVLFVLLAWQSDDAFHGYAMARNLANGNGFVYNAGERVSASTCPFFTLLVSLAYFLTREMFVTSLAVDLLCSLAAVGLLFFRFCRTPWQVAAAFLLCAGKCFVTYTSGGLENGMLYLLAGCMVWLSLLRSRGAPVVFLHALVAGLLAGTRMDIILVFLPYLVWVFFVRRNEIGRGRAVLLGVLGCAPFFLWEAFSLFYYGTPFPNTAYAKLGTGIPVIRYFLRGLSYFPATMIVDPGVVLVPFSVILVVWLRTRDTGARLLGIGIALYFCYVARIGGDFMLGRHFTVIYFLAVCLLFVAGDASSGANPRVAWIDRVGRSGWFRTALLGGALVFLGWSACVREVRGGEFLRGVDFPVPGMMIDERAHYFARNGLVPNLVSRIRDGRWLFVRPGALPDSVRDAGRKRALVDVASGIRVFCNPDVYLTDSFALGDPFLARLPAAPVTGYKFRIGHLRRIVPDGYAESVANDDNEIADPILRDYYDRIVLVTRGPLFSRKRLAAIADLNLHRPEFR